MPSAQDCAERLREQAYKTLLPQIQDLEQELQNIKSLLSTGMQQIGQKLDVLRNSDLPSTELILGELLSEVNRQKELETSALVLFARELRRKETQEEILAFLLDHAQRFFPRIALFTVRGDRFVGWSSRGYSDSAAKAISSCAFPRAEYPQFQDAFDAENPVAASDLPDTDPLVSLKEDAQGPWRVFALRAMKRPIAILLAGEAKGIPSNPEALSILMDLASLRLENIALKILYEIASVKPEPVPQPMPVVAVAATAPEPVLEPLMEMPAAQPPAAQAPVEESIPAAPEVELKPEPLQEPEFIPEPVLAPEPLPEPPPVSEPLFTPPPAPAPEIVRAAPAVADLAPPMAQRMEPPAPAPKPEVPKPAPQEARPIPEEERLHADAKRFARLLVQEIKLYNEKPVIEGRANRDLYLRLKRDIDRSREMYEQRISPTVSSKIDYFHDEIIRILGDNDPSTLGSDYPGPRVDS